MKKKSKKATAKQNKLVNTFTDRMFKLGVTEDTFSDHDLHAVLRESKVVVVIDRISQTGTVTAIGTCQDHMKMRDVLHQLPTVA